MKSFRAAFVSLAMGFVVIGSLLSSQAAAAPPTAIERRLIGLKASGVLSVDTTLSASTCTQISQSLHASSIGQKQVSIYEHVCVETCVYLHQTKAVQEFVVHFHESGTFAGKRFNIDISEIIDIQTIFDKDGCAQVTERARILVDISVLSFDECLKICEKLDIEISAEVTTKEQLMVYLGFEVDVTAGLRIGS